MSIEANKTLVRRFYENFYKDSDAIFEECVAPNLINHAMGGGMTRESWKELEKTLPPAFPDVALSVQDQIAEGDKVATRLILTGTHQGTWFGIAPTGKKLTVNTIIIDRVTDGKVVEHWFESDLSQALQRLGIDLAVIEAQHR